MHFCTLEGVRLDVPGKCFVNPEPTTTPPTQTEQTIARRTVLESLSKKLEAVGVRGSSRGEQTPTLCWAEFEKLAAIPSKPQWIVRALDWFHSALMGVPPIPSEVRCTRDLMPATQGSFPYF